MSGADTAEYQERKAFKVGAQAHNRVPVIKISQSSPLPSRNTFQKILPQPITLIPVSRLQNIKKVDPSNNIEKIVIKTEPGEETDQSTVTTIPFHDFANQTIIRTFPLPVTTTSSSLIFPTTTEIKKEL